ncbi:MAG: site-specific DNA-methyltransferase [Steroidobacteraceae bacterium]
MRLHYEGRRDGQQIIDGVSAASLRVVDGAGAANKLILGENRAVLKALLDRYAGKVGLVYIDPPFATNAHFRVGGNRANSVSSSRRDPIAYSDRLLGPAYLEFLRERLVLLRELLADRGSIYLHIDYKIGHYVKVLMDEVFGAENFRNDVTRIKCNPKNFSRTGYGNVKDMILFYSKSDSPTWREARRPLSVEQAERLFKKTEADGRRYTTVPLHAPGETTRGETSKPWRGMNPPQGRHWRSAPDVLDHLDRQGLIEWSSSGVPRKKIYLDAGNGQKVQDIWEFKDPQHPNYPTEKNLDMLKLIVGASSNEGDLVLDCFCGSGTTLIAAEELGRNWIGIDESPHAVEATSKRLGMAGKERRSAITYELLRQAVVDERGECSDDHAMALSPHKPQQLRLAA